VRLSCRDADESQAGPDTEGSRGYLEAHVPNLPLEKYVESKAGNRNYKNTYF